MSMFRTLASQRSPAPGELVLLTSYFDCFAWFLSQFKGYSAWGEYLFKNRISYKAQFVEKF